MSRSFMPIALALLSSACTQQRIASAAPPAPVAAVAPANVDRVAKTVLSRSNIGGIGIARIEDGRIVWTDYWGEQSPGVPVGPHTAFNTASVAKTLIAETVLRLANRGALSLDDPIADHFRHPDLVGDSRYFELTPRLILSHQAGLRNWAYQYEDRKLAFIAEPGDGEVHYSGAAIMILARYLEERFEKSYPEIVREELLDPLGIEGIAVGREAWLDGRVSDPRGGDGAVYEPFTDTDSGTILELGEWNAADNMYATVPGYAQLLFALIEGRGLSAQLQAERKQLLSSSSDMQLGYVCIADPGDCPDPIGYGIGWAIFGEPGRTVLNHGGNDFAEHAQVYFIPETGEGLILFVNGGNAFPAGIEIIEAVDPELRMTKHYRALIERMKAQKNQ